MSKDNYAKSVFGIGYMGNGIYNSKDKAYAYWKGIMQRSYCKKYQIKHPTYIKCKVDNGWHNYQNFALWFEKNYIDNFVLDKDIIQKGNKIYSDKFCSFVPKEINALFIKHNKKRGKNPIGVSIYQNKYIATISKHGEKIYIGSFDTKEKAFEEYKKEKELYIKEVANKYKNNISVKIYDSMMNYKVDIND